MRYIILLCLLPLLSCYRGDDNPDLYLEEFFLCELPFDPLPVPGFSLELVGEGVFSIRNEFGFVKFQFFDSNNGVAYEGSRDTLFKTVDGGVTWTGMPAVPELTTGVRFLDADRGIATIERQAMADPATGSFPPPKLAITTDGGNSWEMKSYSNIYREVYKPTLGPDGNIYAIGSIDGTSGLLRSVDGGETMERWIDLPLEEYFSNGPTLSSTSVFDLYLSSGSIYVNTKDRRSLEINYEGEIVGALNIGIAGVKSITFPSPQEVMVTGHFSEFLSQDGGASFNSVSAPGAKVISYLEDGTSIYERTTEEECPTDPDHRFKYLGLLNAAGEVLEESEPFDAYLSRNKLRGRHNFRDGRVLLVFNKELYLLRRE